MHFSNLSIHAKQAFYLSTLFVLMIHIDEFVIHRITMEINKYLMNSYFYVFLLQSCYVFF